MTFIPPGLSEALWRVVPAPLRNKLRSNLVKRFVRFAPAAVCAVAATQITYIICLGVLDLTAGISGFLGWLAGAAVSYVISRWAWERKGRPHLLKETLPFVAVSIGAGVVLTLASKLGNQVALSMGLDGAAQVIVADIFYFGANCLTFALRFLIFHYLLFADRRSSDVLAMVEGREPPWADQPDSVNGAAPVNRAPVNGAGGPINGAGGPVNGDTVRHGQAGLPSHPAHPETAGGHLPQPGANGGQSGANGDQPGLDGAPRAADRRRADRPALRAAPGARR